MDNITAIQHHQPENRMSFKQKGFFPYITVVFLNAFVDLGHKIVIQNAIFKSYDGQEQVVLTAIVNGLILLPFILLFSPAGFLADKFAKHRIIRHSAFFAVVATLLITFAYYQGWFWVAFALTFALAVQSAIYSPAKYGYIKELVGNHNLGAANGIVQAVTIAGILLGTLVFSILFEGLLPEGGTASTGEIMSYVAPIGWILVALATLEWFTTSFLPARQGGSATESFELKPYLRLQYLRRNLGVVSEHATIWLSIIGLATFWAISQVMLAAFPAFAKETLDITNTVVIQGILACSGLGIVLGSLLAGRASRNYIETGLIPVGAVGIAIGIAVLPNLSSAYSMGVNFLLVGVMGGIFIVPLNSLIQFQAPEDHLGTVLAGNNWIQNVAMLSALAFTVVFSIVGIDSVGLFYILTAVAVLGTGYTVRKLPHSLVRILAMGILKRRYRVEVIGFDNIPQTGATLMLGNHISWIDWALVQIACPRPIRFVMLKRIYDTWYLKPFFKAFGVVPIAAGRSKESLQTINGLLHAGECVCLFPEGAISRNGQLGKFHTGYERTLEGIDNGVIVPFYLHGLWGSSLSRADEGLRQARAADLKRDLIVAFGPALPLETSANQLKQKVFELSITAWEAYSAQLPPVPLAWLRAARRKPFQLCVADDSRTSLTNQQLVTTVVAMGRQLRLPESARHIGVMLPPGAAATQTIMTVLLQGRVAVPLNHTLPKEAFALLLNATSVDKVITSRAFLEALSEEGTDITREIQGCDVLYLEDLIKGFARWRRLITALQLTWLPATAFYRLHGNRVEATAPAAIMLSEPGEHPPRAVEVSHRNIMANCKQVSDVLNTQVDDVILSCVPAYHPFGLVVSTIMPLVEGIPMACHSKPTDSLGIAKTVARYSATILPGSPGTLDLYTRNDDIHPLMLNSLRLVVSGSEPLPEDVRQQFELKFGRRIYEGFCLAEVTAVAAVNIPDAMDTSDWKVQQGAIAGTMGMPLPGTSLKIIDALSGEELPLGQDGQLLICGSQVMHGYLNDPEKTGSAIIEIEGQRWLKTSNTGHLTEEGFLVLQ
jgi:acyl-[acyl-carrier-protein]-phospholipid O-acyltransferase/long-chain-fatty-acid--[acyl-carrier-protein] ligase